MGCQMCGDRLGKLSTWYCDDCRKSETERMVKAMRKKRAADPAYREMERKAVKIRMRNLRAERRLYAKAYGVSPSSAPNHHR